MQFILTLRTLQHLSFLPEYNRKPCVSVMLLLWYTIVFMQTQVFRSLLKPVELVPSIWIGVPEIKVCVWIY